MSLPEIDHHMTKENSEKLNLQNDDEKTKLLWSEFMNRVGLDVFQFILSFLPPIPYLFQLKRVSSHWKELCEECMKEDCTELYWDQNSCLSVLHFMKVNLREYSKKMELPDVYEDYLVDFRNEIGNYVMLGFFRNVLMSFRKLRSITFRNMELNAAMLYLIFVEWGQEVENIKFVACEMDLSKFRKIVCFGEDSQSFFTYSTNLNLITSMGFDHSKPKYELDTILQTTLDKMKESKLKNIDFYGCLCCKPGANSISQDILLPLELICLVSAFGNLESAYYDFAGAHTFSTKDNIELFRKINPQVKFSVSCTEIASKMLIYSKFEEVLDYYFSYLSNKFALRKNRLKAYQNRKLQTREQFDNFHLNIIPKLVNFFQLHSPFGLDTELKDIQGFNILQIAISAGFSTVIDFIFDYFSIYNEDMDCKEDTIRIMNHLFASNNRLDGRNSTFIVVTKEETDIINKMIANKVHFNARDKEGSTVAHYFSQFGQLSKLKYLVIILDKLPTMEERNYYLNFNVTNNEGETPISLCYKYKMFALLRYLAEIAPRYGIQNIPEKLPAEIILTPESFANAHKRNDEKKDRPVEPKKSCSLM